MKQSEQKTRYHPGTIPIPDTRWSVETRVDGAFMKIGEVTVTGKEVSDAMDAHKSIKGYTPDVLAKKKAHEKYPDANPIIVIEMEKVEP